MNILSIGPDPNYIVEYEGKIYRRIGPNPERRWGRFLEFTQSKDFHLLYEAGFIPEHGKPVIMNDEKLLPVKRIKHVTKQKEWTQQQVIEATLFSVRLNIFLQMIDSEFRAIDCHLGNVTYQHSEPIYIDIGSFSDIRFDMIGDHLDMDIKHLQLNLTNNLFRNYEILSNYKPERKSTEWDNYDKSSIKSANEIFPVNAEEKLISEWIDMIKPVSVFDAGSNAGRLSRLIAIKGLDVVSADMSEIPCDRNREIARRLNLKITTAFINLSKEGEWRSRLRCEAALASSITHHLYKHGMNWQEQAKLWNDMTEEWLLIEFIDKNDVHVKQWGLDNGYNYQEFIKSLDKWELKSTANPENIHRTWCLFGRKTK